MKVTPALHVLIAVLLLALSGAGEAAKSGTRSSSSGKATAGAAATPEEDDEDAPEAKPDPRLDQGKAADEKLKAEKQRKREEMERLADQADVERQVEAARVALEKKKKEEQLRQQQALERRCVLRPVMTDAEIAKCK